MATTVVTAVDALKIVVKDRDAQVLSTAEYTAFVAGHVVPGTTDQTFKAYNAGNGLFVSGLSDVAIWNPSISESGGTAYVIYAAGSGGMQAAPCVSYTGTDSRTSIDITGRRIYWSRLLVEMLTYIATHRAQEYSQSSMGGSVSPETARAELLRQASILRGPVAF